MRAQRSALQCDPRNLGSILGVDSLSILFNPRSFPRTGCFPWVSGGFLERFGSLERMEVEGTPRKCVSVLFLLSLPLRTFFLIMNRCISRKKHWKEWTWKLPLASAVWLARYASAQASFQDGPVAGGHSCERCERRRKMASDVWPMQF